MYETFKVKCPHCGSNEISVIKATLAATGKKLKFASKLHADGFEVPVTNNTKDASTEDEVARCDTCKREFPLADLFLD